MNEKTKRWIYLAIIVVLLSTVYIIYHVGVSPYKSSQADAIALAKKNTNLKTPETFYLYNRNEQNWTVGGLDKSNRKIFVIINPKTNRIVVLNQNAGISKKTAINRVVARYNPKQIHNVALGIYKKKPVWEVTYQNKDDTIGFETFDFKTGRVVQRTTNV